MKPIKDHPRYAAVATDLAALHFAQGKVQARISELESLLAAYKAYDHGETQVAAALRFAETEKIEVDTTPQSYQDEHLLLREQSAALATAIEKKNQELAAVRGEISVEVCRDVKAQHKKMAARAVELLEQLDALFGEEREFIQSIESAGYNAAFSNYVTWPVIGRLSERSASSAWHFHAEMKAYAN